MKKIAHFNIVFESLNLDWRHQFCRFGKHCAAGRDRRFAALLLSMFILAFCPAASFAAPGRIDFSFYDAPIKDVAVMVSELCDISISGSFGDKRMTLIADDVALEEVLPIFRSSLSSVGLTLVKMDWGYVVRPVEQGFDPGSDWAVHNLTYVAAEDVKNAVAAALGTSGTVSAVGPRQILITGPVDQVRKFSAMIRSFDIARTPDVDRVPLKYIRVSTAISRVQESSKSVFLIPDYWGRSVIIQGPPADRALAAETIRNLDQPPPGMVSRLLPLHSQDPAQVLAIVANLFDDVSVHVAGSSLFLFGPSELVEEASRIVAEVDASMHQVRVECVIASMTDQELEELGIRMSRIADSSRIQLNNAGIESLLGPGPGLLVDIISGTNSISVAARDQRQKGTIISSPTLTALSGQSARIVVGQNVPFIDRKTRTDSGESEFSVVRQDIGVSLSITPKVEGDFVFLKIAQEVSNIDPSARNAVDIITDKKQIESTVKLADGETIFLGGVKSLESGNTREAIPVLSRLPLVGDIFTYRKSSETNRNIVVSLRPTIIRQRI